MSEDIRQRILREFSELDEEGQRQIGAEVARLLDEQDDA